jgi:hypothetical protein
MGYTVNLNTAGMSDDGFEYKTLEEALAALGRLAKSCEEYTAKDGIDRNLTLYFTSVERDDGEEEETFSTPCGSMTSDETREHVKECGVCADEHAETPLDI